jgi:hypothetical protein
MPIDIQYQSTSVVKPSRKILDGLSRNSDNFGSMCSALCLLHCIATPIFFMSRGATSCCANAPVWWSLVDFVFLPISLAAVALTVESTSNIVVRIGLIASWLFLCIAVLNERFLLFNQPAHIISISTILLIVFHTYNRFFCSCTSKCPCGPNASND